MRELIETVPQDQLQLKANAKVTTGERLMNGELVTVKRVKADGSIRLDDGRILPPDFRQFVRGYAVTSYDRAKLAAWCRKAIGDGGWIWTESTDSREETARQFFLGAAKEIGESHLAQQAESRLKWQRIGYVSHKDYSFRWQSNWFDELSAADPSVVKDQGLRLLTLLDACDAQGGDNRWSSDLHASIGAAAIASGPADVWRVMFSDRGHRDNWRWFESAKILFLDGFLDRLARPMPMEEMITCWCLSISLARWYDAADVG